MSTVTIPAPRRHAVSLGRRAGMVGLVIAILTLAATASWAYWSSTGNGTGTAATGTLNPPTAVTASPTSGSGDVEVLWSAPASGSTPDGYYVQRIDSGDVAAPACGTSPTNPTTETACTDLGVEDGVYSYVVTAVMNSWTAASEASESVTVVNIIPTTTTLAPSVNPSVVGQPVTYTATVAADSGTPEGSVTFMDGASAVTCAGGDDLDGSGEATCVLTYADAGSYSITAQYVPTGNFAPSTSEIVTQTVDKAATSTALGSSSNPSKAGEEVTYTATVTVSAPGAGTPTGTVTFTEGAATICDDVELGAGEATCAVTYPTVGDHQVTASYSGDTRFDESASAALNQSVEQAATSTALVSGQNPVVTGQPVTFTATVSVTEPGVGSPTGTVTFTDGANEICVGVTLSSGQATCTTSFDAAGGAKSITAVYSGSTDLAGSSSNTVSQTVNAAATSTSLAASPSPSTTGQSVTLTATVTANSPGTGTPAGTVHFKDADGTIGSCDFVDLVGGVATCTTTFATAGSKNLTAEYSGDDSYNASTGSASHTVNTPVSTTTTVSSSKNPAKSGETITYTATVSAASGTPAGTATFLDGGNPITCTGGNQTLSGGQATCQVTYPNMGTHTITATYSGQGVHVSSTSAPLTQRVVNAAVTGIVIEGVSGATSGTCPLGGTSAYSCTVPGSNNQALVSATVAFVNSLGQQVAYSDSVTTVMWSRNRPTNPTTGTVVVSGDVPASTTMVEVQKQGNGNPGQLTFTLSDGLNSFTATLNVS